MLDDYLVSESEFGLTDLLDVQFEDGTTTTMQVTATPSTISRRPSGVSMKSTKKSRQRPQEELSRSISKFAPPPPLLGKTSTATTVKRSAMMTVKHSARETKEVSRPVSVSKAPRPAPVPITTSTSVTRARRSIEGSIIRVVSSTSTRTEDVDDDTASETGSTTDPPTHMALIFSIDQITGLTALLRPHRRLLRDAFRDHKGVSPAITKFHTFDLQARADASMSLPDFIKVPGCAGCGRCC